MKVRARISILTIALVLVACGSEEPVGEEAPALASPTPGPTQAIMRDILESLQVALPASANQEAFRDPANQAKIAAALEELASAVAVLEEHTAQKDPQMRFLARSIERDSREAQRDFANKRYDRAGFLLHKITENCIVCHTRLECENDCDFSRNFISPSELETMDLESRSSLQIATRRFEDALDTLEELLASPESPALMLGPLTDYLVISIRVKNDYERPVPTLRRFTMRPDIWTSLREYVEGWIDALPRLHERVQSAPTLATARALIAEGAALNRFEGSYAALVHNIVASTILEKLIAADPQPGPELGESFFLLGIVESRIGRNYWVTPAPFLFETSIRLAPGEPYARKAYTMLEREMLKSYEGSPIEELPGEDRERLSELRALMSAAQ